MKEHFIRALKISILV